MKQRAAVLGTGQTHHRAKRPDVSMAGLCREAIDRAMADAQVEWSDIDAVVVGKAPDLFGVWDYQINKIVPGPQCAKAGFGGGQYKTTLCTLSKIEH